MKNRQLRLPNLLQYFQFIRGKMNLSEYLENKCLETASIELVKQAILEDMTLSSVQKQNWLSLINTMATVKNMTDICKILSRRM